MAQDNNPGLKTVCNELEAIMSIGHSNYKVFEDWIGLMFYAFQHDDPHYLEIMAKYPNKAKEGMREADHFANATAALMEYMQKTSEEALGELYMQYAANEYKGQFFTPMSVSRASAGMILQDMPKDRRFTVGDPSCGAGIMFVAAAKEMSFEENGRAVFVGVDIDLNCVRMCALNMLFFNLNALIIWGNSLSLECHDAWFTKRSVAFGGTLGHVEDLSLAEAWMRPFEQKQTVPVAPEPAMTRQKKTKGTSQLLLFGN